MATPFKMKNSALYKSAKHGSPMQKNFTSTVREVYEGTMPKVLQNVNKFLYDKLTGNKASEKPTGKIKKRRKMESMETLKAEKLPTENFLNQTTLELQGFKKPMAQPLDEFDQTYDPKRAQAYRDEYSSAPINKKSKTKK